jgi:YD repeat-containing protein
MTSQVRGWMESRRNGCFFTTAIRSGPSRWHSCSKLIEVKKNDTIIVNYKYDPSGLRVVRDKPGGAKTHYVFEGTEVIFEKNISTGSIKSYVYAFGKHLARVDGKIGDTAAKKYFCHTDHLGSVKAVTDQTGTVVYKADFFAFGKQLYCQLEL